MKKRSWSFEEKREAEEDERAGVTSFQGAVRLSSFEYDLELATVTSH